MNERAGGITEQCAEFENMGQGMGMQGGEQRKGNGKTSSSVAGPQIKQGEHP